jgi:hypothetical protein
MAGTGGVGGRAGGGRKVISCFSDPKAAHMTVENAHRRHEERERNRPDTADADDMVEDLHDVSWAASQTSSTMGDANDINQGSSGREALNRMFAETPKITEGILYGQGEMLGGGTGVRECARGAYLGVNIIEGGLRRSAIRGKGVVRGGVGGGGCADVHPEQVVVSVYVNVNVNVWVTCVCVFLFYLHIHR